MGERLFSTLIPKLSPHVPGCPQPLMLQAVRDAAVRICEKTLAWRYAQPPFALLPGVHEYFYAKPNTTDVHVVFEALVNGEPLEKLTLEQAIMLYPEWADLYNGIDPSQIWSSLQPNTFNAVPFNETQFNETLPATLSPAIAVGGSEPRSITQLTPDKFVVLPIPDDAETYSMRMFYALKPKRNATSMDEAVFDDLEEPILHSALQYLCIMPNVAWSNRELAVYFGKLALFQNTERRARANLTNMRGSVLVRIPRIA
jgi:hypothetical protein